MTTGQKGGRWAASILSCAENKVSGQVQSRTGPALIPNKLEDGLFTLDEAESTQL
jgi:hypothetical protein